LEQALLWAGEISWSTCDWENAWPLGELAQRSGEGLSAHLRERLALGRSMTAEAYGALISKRDEMRQRLLALSGEVDACITLSAAGPAPMGLAHTGSAAFNLPASALRAPALSLPLLRVGDLPVGVQLIGYPDRDRDLSAIAGFLDRPTSLAHLSKGRRTGH
jgi:Asp-tRNA(Asn)/Glu-tRNA(Gln) amidotransferase A subunit family amidase